MSILEVKPSFWWMSGTDNSSENLSLIDIPVRTTLNEISIKTFLVIS